MTTDNSPQERPVDPTPALDVAAILERLIAENPAIFAALDVGTIYTDSEGTDPAKLLRLARGSAGLIYEP